MPRLLVLLAACAACAACAAGPTVTTSPTALPLGEGSFRFQRGDRRTTFDVTGSPAGLVTVFVAIRDTVYVFHASAALGTGVYQRDGDHYRRVRDFTWQCRDRLDGGCRERFLAAEHWWGETYPQGSATRQLVIGDELLEHGAAVVLVSYTYPRLIATWPERLGDDAASEEILQGSLPVIAHFDPRSWAKVSASFRTEARP